MVLEEVNRLYALVTLASLEVQVFANDMLINPHTSGASLNAWFAQGATSTSDDGDWPTMAWAGGDAWMTCVYQ